MPKTLGHTLSIGEILLSIGSLTPEDLERAAQEKERSPLERFGQILRRLNLVTDEQLREALAIQYGIPFVRLSRRLVDPDILEVLPYHFIQKYRVIPMFRVERELTVALEDPTNLFLVDEIGRITNCEILPVLAPSADLDSMLVDVLADQDQGFDIDDIIEDLDEGDVQVIEKQVEDLANLEEVAGMSPVVRLVNYILFRAIRDGASDIHVEPEEVSTRVRNRIDGMLVELMTLPQHMQPAIVSRVKVMADLDISERRRPQDGRFKVKLERRPVDLRVSTIPTVTGEKVVIRILDRSTMRIDLTNLGMASSILGVFREMIHMPDGIILITGPTGSGKTTSLYAILQEINSSQLNLCTVENPVEYHIRGINQVQVNERGVFSFSDALRSLLRQDPDVIMIGEIRDHETATIAVQASLTGHLVLATLHTNDAPSAATRLINMGIEPYLISASLRGVLSQRLVRRLCPHCKKPGRLSRALREKLGSRFPEDGVVYEASGCSSCRNTGYMGRVGLYELMVVSDELSDLISTNPNLGALRNAAFAQGMEALLMDGVRKVAEGITSMNEVLRVAWS